MRTTAKPEQPPLHFTHPWVARLRAFAHRPWYIPLIVTLAAIDLFVGVVPTDALLISSVLLRRENWVSLWLLVTTGSAVGAVALCWIVKAYGVRAIDFLLGDALQSEGWASTNAFLSEHGAVALGLMAFGPLPQQPAVVLCALADMSLLAVFVAVWLGRGVKYGIWAWCAAHAPHVLAKIFKGSGRG